MTYLGEWRGGVRDGKGVQRSVMRLASGAIARDYLVEYSGDTIHLAPGVKNSQIHAALSLLTFIIYPVFETNYFI